MRALFILVILGVIGALAYVRLAPVDAARWNQIPDITAPGDTETENSFTAARQITTPPEQMLQVVEQIALATPRTQTVAGSLASGMVTYQTRSQIFGFPDYSTVAIVETDAGPLMVIHARARFGKSDLGVNKARVEDWLAQLGPLVVAP